METKTQTIEDVINQKAQRERIDIHTALPGRVVAFDVKNNAVSVEPMIKQVLHDGSLSELPVLVDVPVEFPRGGGFVLTFPIAPGDEGLIVFSERCIDGWWQTGEKSEPLDYRLHDYSDASFIPGISSLPKVIKNIYMEGASLRTEDDETYIRLSKGTIYIKGNIVHEGDTQQKGSYDQEGDYKQKGDTERDGSSTTKGLITGSGGLSISGTNPQGEVATIDGGGGKFTIRNVQMDWQSTTTTYDGASSITHNGIKIDNTHTHDYSAGGGTTERPNK